MTNAERKLATGLFIFCFFANNSADDATAPISPMSQQMLQNAFDPNPPATVRFRSMMNFGFETRESALPEIQIVAAAPHNLIMRNESDRHFSCCRHRISASDMLLKAGERSGCGILASMFTIRTRWRWWWIVAIATALIVSVAALLLKSKLEQGVRARIESAAVRHGAVAHPRLGERAGATSDALR
jgi:hypothetical protein